jgi:hypothetical protein
MPGMPATTFTPAFCVTERAFVETGVPLRYFNAWLRPELKTLGL